MYNSGVPIAKFTWDDRSGASSDVLFSTDTDGLNVPFFFLLSERGVPGQIYFGGGAELTKILGSSTFNESGPYYNNSTLFASTAMAGQGICVMPLRDPNATTADLGLFLEVVPGPVIQYEKDVSGKRVVDLNGDFIPLPGAGGASLTELGFTVRWIVRGLTNLETIDSLETTNGDGTITYPILGFKVNSSGKYGNRQGFSLYSTGTETASLAESINSVLYRFVPLELPTTVSTTASPIPDVFGNSSNDVSFKSVAVDQNTSVNYAFNYVISTTYARSATGESLLPYEVYAYSDNIRIIGEDIKEVSPELGAIDPYLIDLISGKDLDGNHYDHIAINPASSTVVSSDVVNYCLGGSDGLTTQTVFEGLIQDWLEGSNHGEFTNLQQHPITHFSDPGFSMATKLLLFNMLGLRDNLKLDISTQDTSLKANTQAQDMAAGLTLAMRAQMFPESTIAGVGCTRVGIYAHAARLINSSAYTGLVPFTLNRLIERRDLDGGLYVKGSSGGLPNSQVTIFQKPNWIADDEDLRKLAWGRAINVVQHASRTVFHYASLRTVYPNDTSLLSDDEISDRILYTFKIARRMWSKYAGVKEPQGKIYPIIERDIDQTCAAAFSSDVVTVTSNVFQTAADANLGYATSINLNVAGNFPLRQFNYNVIVSRAPAA